MAKLPPLKPHGRGGTVGFARADGGPAAEWPLLHGSAHAGAGRRDGACWRTGGGASATGYGLETNYSVSGSRPVGAAYMLDDPISATRRTTAPGSAIGTSLGMDAIQEFRF